MIFLVSCIEKQDLGILLDIVGRRDWFFLFRITSNFCWFSLFLLRYAVKWCAPSCWAPCKAELDNLEIQQWCDKIISECPEVEMWWVTMLLKGSTPGHNGWWNVNLLQGTLVVLRPEWYNEIWMAGVLWTLQKSGRRRKWMTCMSSFVILVSEICSLVATHKISQTVCVQAHACLSIYLFMVISCRNTWAF